MSRIKAFIESIKYYNEDNYYAVLTVSEGNDLFTCVGHFPYISAGETIDAEGEMTVHPVYGLQFQVTSYELIRPQTTDMIERYLASGAIHGIGAGLAARIVKKFKADTFRIIEEEPERLSEIKGISEASARRIAEQFEMKRSFRNALMYMQKYGIGNVLAQKIYSFYGPVLYSVFEGNPYRLADDIEGIGFRLADSIAVQNGLSPDSGSRIRSGILYTLREAVGQGHTWLPKDELVRYTAELLLLDPQKIEEALPDLQMEGSIVRSEDGTQVYTAACYYIERNIAFRLKDLNIHEENEKEQALERIREICGETGIRLDEKQEEAVLDTVSNGVLILTGGPGTGKTTTINTIIRFYEKENFQVMLAAPTGRAAKRMTEASGREAKTIHRLLEYTGAPEKNDAKGTFESYGGSGNAGGAGSTDGKGRFLRDEKDPLECDVLIIDEMSMVDIFLMEALLKAVVPGTRVIFSGDADQLPSVGAGNVLRDMIASGAYRTVCLTHIFRQAAESDIVLNAHRINSGEPVDLSRKSSDFIFIRGSEPDAILSYIKTLITRKLPDYVHSEPLSIQVLTPTRKGALGVEILNQKLQEFLNPPDPGKKERRLGEILFREGDKVMQIRNNYDTEWERVDENGLTVEKGSGIFNGDMGIIRQIDPENDTVSVQLDDSRLVVYSAKNIKELELSYAVTVHKSQGSEYPAVVIPVYYAPGLLMNRNLLYTAVTRAKKCVCLVGLPAVFEKMAANPSESRRYSGLKDRIQEIEWQADLL